MYDEQVRSELTQPKIVRLTTIQPDGYPHTVPVWFMLDGDDIIVFTGSQSRKVKNALDNKKGNIAFGGDPVGSPCFTIVGDIEVEPDPEHLLTAKITYHYETAENAREYLEAWENDEHVILRLKPHKVIQVGA